MQTAKFLFSFAIGAIISYLVSAHHFNDVIDDHKVAIPNTPVAAFNLINGAESDEQFYCSYLVLASGWNQVLKKIANEESGHSMERRKVAEETSLGFKNSVENRLRYECEQYNK